MLIEIIDYKLNYLTTNYVPTYNELMEQFLNSLKQCALSIFSLNTYYYKLQ